MKEILQTYVLYDVDSLMKAVTSVPCIATNMEHMKTEDTYDNKTFIFIIN